MFEVVRVEDLIPGDVLFTGSRVTSVRPHEEDMIAYDVEGFGEMNPVIWVRGTKVTIEKRRAVLAS